MKIIVLIICLFQVFNLSAEEYKPIPIENVEMVCGKEKSEGIQWSYCISKTKDSENKNILYHLHGRNGNATWWNDKDYHTGKIHKEWIKNKKSPPVVVSISFGKVWLLLKNKEKSGYLDIFLNHVVNKIETKLDFTPKRRDLIGISMGGLNAFYLSMSNSSLFKKSAILCAHIPFITHHDGLLNLIRYKIENNISLKRSFMMYKISRTFFLDKSIQELNDSNRLLLSYDAKRSPELYVTCGKKDDWGCMKSSKDVFERVVNKGGKAIWSPRNGGHCDLNHSEIAMFLIE